MDYGLLDFGGGRRLERFGTHVFDRVCPAASEEKQLPDIWNQADARYDGTWSKYPPPQTVSFGIMQLEVRCTPFGHLGVFPEQMSNWQQLAAERKENLRILNLFAYTGGSSIAAAKSNPNAEVVHVDAARGIVEWAKHNAALNGIHSIRFITEDARKFVQRELKRGRRYDAVILDPPSYGHGVKGEPWKIVSDLPFLLADIALLLSDEPAYILLTAHTAGDKNAGGPAAFKIMLTEAGMYRKANFMTETFTMRIPSSNGSELAGGYGVWLKRNSS
ncbi:MAG: class I SAM-dependent methyltransferase [Planctomycetaceae bacterium]|jgi:23S rRNA (cytosine1962-C5)-methyltransferase|nr:class I SAM-dependent methyltransferase [Planctomycetaceae bacterium]